MNNMKDQKCPICGTGSLRKEIGAETFEYKGKSISIPNYVTYACDACGEAIVDNNTMKKSGKILKAFKREVDGLLTAEQIKAIRAKLGLTQNELAEIVGGGAKSLARYESGQVCQSRGMDNLLRILDAYPHTLNVIQKKESSSKTTGNIAYFEEYKYKMGKEDRLKGKTSAFTVDTQEAAYGS
ncbi:MAG: HTH-type transcriptional regulator / antitoxin for MqsR toxin [Nitrospirae bacterium]|nr:MAG: HTH-type transcriptional regulator / antitoxin for MqsR toxin [Nitrospirota bacterium]